MPTDQAKDHRRQTVPVWLVAALLPLIVATTLCVTWTLQNRFRIRGDEPHYLIMARSVAWDHDLDLKNNYEEDALTRAIYGEVIPHAYHDGERWPPYHSAGLSLLLAYPFRYAGFDGARLTLIAVATLLPIMVLWWLRDYLSPRSALLLGATLALSVPLAVAPLHFYPDLPAAALLTTTALTLLHWWQNRSVPPLTLWVAIWIAAGFLPWLQSRFLAPWLLLMFAGVLIALRAPAAPRLRLLAGLFVSLAAVALLLVLNDALYQNALGPPRWDELTRSPGRMTMMFLGLHLDQTQGLFMQQPLWLFGLIGLAPFVRAYPRQAAWLALVYLSTIGPASMQMGRFGGDGTIGRYAWPAAFLWVVPLRHFAAARPAYFARGVAVALALQLIMLLRWMPAPELLAVNLDQRVWARESLWPSQLRYVLPSFYFWDFSSYARYPPNAVAIAGAVLLVWTGIALRRNEAWRHVGRVWWVWLAVAGLLLPASSEKDGSSAEEGRIAAAVRASTSRLTQRFEAERLPPRSIAGTTRVDADSSNGEARSTAGASSEAVLFGPYLALDAGSYTVVAAMRLQDEVDPAVELASLQITARRGRDVLAQRRLFARDLVPSRYTHVRLPFALGVPTEDVEFTVVMLRAADLWVDYVEFVQVPP